MLRQLLFASTFFLSFGFSHAQIQNTNWALQVNTGIGHGLSGQILSVIPAQLLEEGYLNFNFFTSIHFQRRINKQFSVLLKLQHSAWMENIFIYNENGVPMRGAKSMFSFVGGGAGIQYQLWRSRSRKSDINVFTTYSFSKVYKQRFYSDDLEPREWITFESYLSVDLHAINLGFDYNYLFWRSQNRKHEMAFNLQVLGMGGVVQLKHWGDEAYLTSVNLSCGVRYRF